MDAFSLSDAPAVVEWRSADAQELLYSHRQVHCSLSFDLSREMASFRLRFSVSLVAASRTKRFLHLLIDPHRISSAERIVEVPEAATSRLKGEAVGIRFRLTRPGQVLVPPGLDLIPKNKAAGDTLEMLEVVAHATEVSFYLLQKSISVSQLESLCGVTQYSCWKPSPSLSRAHVLYGGKGALVVEGNAFALSAPSSPPSYDELAPSPPPPPPLVPSKRAAAKRPRADSPEDNSQHLCDTCESLLERKMREMEARLLAKLDGRIEEKVLELKGEINNRIDELKGEWDEEIEGLKDEWGDERDDVVKETGDVIDMKIDDQFLSVKCELTDHVTEELQNVEERIWRDLQDTTFSINP